METIKSLFISLCFTITGVSLVLLLTPKGNMEKVIRFAAGLFILSALITPFATSKFKLSFSGFQSLSVSQQQNSELKDEIKKQYEQQLIRYINDYLENKQIHDSKIFIEMDINERYIISISKIRILVSGKSSPDPSSLKKELEKMIDTTIEIQIEDGEQQ